MSVTIGDKNGRVWAEYLFSRKIRITIGEKYNEKRNEILGIFILRHADVRNDVLRLFGWAWRIVVE